MENNDFINDYTFGVTRRYNSDELIYICKDIVYKYLVSNNDLYSGRTVAKCTDKLPTVAHLLNCRYFSKMKEDKERINDLVSVCENVCSPEDKSSISAHINYLEEEFKMIGETNMETQKERYSQANKCIDYCKTTMSIPLNKLINSYYDDFWLEVGFFDDVTTPLGKFEIYNDLTSEERLQFLKDNTEITHLSLSIRSSSKNNAIISLSQLLGNTRSKDDLSFRNIELLSNKFSDFTSLRLIDTSEIKNNDLRQIYQSKIDLDKAGLRVITRLKVRGDDYTLLSFKAGDTTRVKFSEKGIAKYWIRYVCPSTQRVYFNDLDLDNLRLSPYFDSRVPKTYIQSWWSITHLGMPCEGEDMVRC